jgi:hypothetical protein
VKEPLTATFHTEKVLLLWLHSRRNVPSLATVMSWQLQPEIGP